MASASTKHPEEYAEEGKIKREKDPDAYRDECDTDVFLPLAVDTTRAQSETELIRALAAYDAPATFCVHGRAGGLELPGLVLNGTRVDAPLHQTTLAELVADGTLTAAPFGLGDKTLVDPNVRRTLQASPAYRFFVCSNMEGTLIGSGCGPLEESPKRVR